MGHWDYGDREGCSCIVSDEGKRATYLVTAQHRVLVIRSVQHHMRMPRTDSRSEVLIRREHVRECHRFHFRQLTFGVRRLDSFGNLVRRLAFHSEPGTQLLQRQNRAARDRIKADWRSELCVVHEISERCRRKRRRGPAAHDDAHEAVVTLGSNLVSSGCKYLNRGMRRNIFWSRTSRQCYLGFGRHHVFTERRVLGTLPAY